jgi:hypothetical protein
VGVQFDVEQVTRHDERRLDGMHEKRKWLARTDGRDNYSLGPQSQWLDDIVVGEVCCREHWLGEIIRIDDDDVDFLIERNYPGGLQAWNSMVAFENSLRDCSYRRSDVA